MTMPTPQVTLGRTPRRVSVSTWALHPLIGTVTPGRPGDPNAAIMAGREGSLSLLEVPAELAKRGIRTMEMCHFHLPSRDPDYLADLRSAIEAAGVELWSFLIDDGDITAPEQGDRDRDWIADWITTASHLGTRCVRVIAGRQPTSPEALRYARAQLTQLIVHAYIHGIHVMTENWFPLLSTPDAVHELLDSLSGSLGLTLDFGNWDSHADKYSDLAAIAGRAVGSHAKCGFADGKPLADDFQRCLEITREADYSGPYTLVHGEPGGVWESIEAQRELVTPFL